MKWIRFAIALSVMLALAPVVLADQPQELIPRVTFEPKAVVVSGVPPGSAVAILGVNLVRDRGLAYNRRIATQITAGADGVARLDLASPVNVFSRWAVIEMSTGGYAIATPPGSPLRQWTEVRETPRPGHSGLADVLVSTRPYSELLVVSPKHGAWQTTSGDGYNNDADGKANGQTSIALDALKPLDPSYQTLRVFRPGDVVVVIDTYSFDYSAHVVRQ